MLTCCFQAVPTEIPYKFSYKQKVMSLKYVRNLEISITKRLKKRFYFTENSVKSCKVAEQKKAEYLQIKREIDQQIYKKPHFIKNQLIRQEFLLRQRLEQLHPLQI